jgi:hypothetical protein
VNLNQRIDRYEIFSHRGETMCFDDASMDRMPTPEGMFEWIRSQDITQWRGLNNYPTENCAFYLTPELYLIWKLTWV